MRQLVRTGRLASIVILLGSLASARGQAPAPAPAPARGTAPSAGPTGQPPRPAILDQAVATVNGEPITRGELIGYLSQYMEFTPGKEQDMYRVGIEGLANHKLVVQYLNKAKIPVTEKEIDEQYALLADAMKKDGRDIAVVLASEGLSVAQVRGEMRQKLLWMNYLKLVATDAVLQKYMGEHKDVFNRSQVRASHIVLRAEEDAPEAEKAKVKARLASIRAEIESKKISFADAANKYSEDDVNKTKSLGGDLGYFTRRGQFEPNFSAAAFALKPGEMSREPVETPYGFHLIQVTDRKEGTPVDFKQNRLLVEQEYAADIQERIVVEMRKTAKIDIKPMPADLFPKAPAAGPAALPDPAEPAAARPAAKPARP